MPAFIDLTGRTFGRWTVIGRVENNKHKQPHWLCRCDCGAEGRVNGQNLRSGKSSSCGCYNLEVRADICRARSTHGHSRQGARSLTYRRWRAMHDRCRAKNSTAFPNYGGKGVLVCERWASFEAFLVDVGECPSPLHTLDRLSNSRGYEPGNCRWATMKEQQNNRTNNRHLTFGGETMTLAQWAERVAIKASTIERRINAYGWPVERALTEPATPGRRPIRCS